MENLLAITALSGGYHNNTIIKDISLEIKRGDFLGICGPNGSGKTTLLRLMSRVMAPQKGNILLLGQDIASMRLKEFCRKTAFVSQDATINFAFTVFEVALMGRIPHLKRLQFETERDFDIAENALKVTDALNLKEKRIDELSSGERQRVAIAKALTQEPILLLLDEPTSHLDIGHQIQVLDLLRKLNRQSNLTIVTVLHDLNLAGEYCNRVILVNEGKIFKQGCPEEVLTYQNIESVYKTAVVVNKNPVSGKPYVVLVPADTLCPRN
ncbi:MAG: ABC transporter ATP-binding protein [Candidatus Omnitrophica bacterium]|nr:ABC transporter ATP-binding protein [Candidatus Omnitrophota bacterium]